MSADAGLVKKKDPWTVTAKTIEEAVNDAISGVLYPQPLVAFILKNIAEADNHALEANARIGQLMFSLNTAAEEIERLKALKESAGSTNSESFVFLPSSNGSRGVKDPAKVSGDGCHSFLETTAGLVKKIDPSTVTEKTIEDAVHEAIAGGLYPQPLIDFILSHISNADEHVRVANERMDQLMFSLNKAAEELARLKALTEESANSTGSEGFVFLPSNNGSGDEEDLTKVTGAGGHSFLDSRVGAPDGTS